MYNRRFRRYKMAEIKDFGRKVKKIMVARLRHCFARFVLPYVFLSADNVHIYVILIEFKPEPLFKHGDYQAKSVIIYAVGGTPRRGECCGGDESLNFCNYRASSLNGAHRAISGSVLRSARK